MRETTGWIMATALLLSISGVSAESLQYTIQVPDGKAVTYELEIEVRHAGTLGIRAEWSGKRSLSLKLIPPGQAYGDRLRSGPSPQAIVTEVDAASGDLGVWQLRIHALADRGTGEGMLSIETPEAIPDRPATPEPVSAPAAPADPWMLPPDLPPRVPVASLPFLEATETYRRSIVGDSIEAPSDVCQWQSGLMRYLAEQRDELVALGPQQSGSTVHLLMNIVQAIDAVEEMRTSDDPLVAGPAPSESDLRNAWIRLRRTKIDPVEDDLDEILRMVKRDFAAELEEEPWPIRFVSCLTACERFFEQRTRLGEARAENRELAESQWPRILAASEALAALAEARSGSASPR